jgi:diguanylate cyclase (GGDEF)-like protein
MDENCEVNGATGPQAEPEPQRVGEDDATIVGRPGEQPTPAGESCLVMIYGPNLGKKYVLNRPEITIGRERSCNVMIPLPNVSRVHCRVQTLGRSVYLSDLRSTNGTFVNEVALEPEGTLELRSGDLIRVGGAIFKFLFGGNVEALYHEEIYHTMIIDGLTQVNNRRFLTEFLEREMARCLRHDRPLSLAMFDIDRFKEVNDQFGHLGGDQVLRELGSLVKTQIRREECLARYGGEEFAVVLPEMGLEAARTFAERMRSRVAEHGFRVEGHAVTVTISVGLAEMSPEIQDCDQFIQKADSNLYEAKRSGRNCVVG